MFLFSAVHQLINVYKVPYIVHRNVYVPSKASVRCALDRVSRERPGWAHLAWGSQPLRYCFLLSFVQRSSYSGKFCPLWVFSKAGSSLLCDLRSNICVVTIYISTSIEWTVDYPTVKGKQSSFNCSFILNQVRLPNPSLNKWKNWFRVWKLI